MSGLSCEVIVGLDNISLPSPGDPRAPAPPCLILPRPRRRCCCLTEESVLPLTDAFESNCPDTRSNEARVSRSSSRVPSSFSSGLSQARGLQGARDRGDRKVDDVRASAARIDRDGPREPSAQGILDSACCEDNGKQRVLAGLDVRPRPVTVRDLFEADVAWWPPLCSQMPGCSGEDSDEREELRGERRVERLGDVCAEDRHCREGRDDDVCVCCYTEYRSPISSIILMRVRQESSVADRVNPVLHSSRRVAWRLLRTWTRCATCYRLLVSLAPTWTTLVDAWRESLMTII